MSWIRDIKSFGLSQLIKNNWSGTLIDHIYTNKQSNISNSGVISFMFSDHFMTFFESKVNFGFKLLKSNKSHFP